jgi:type VI protein secretion system component VasK
MEQRQKRWLIFSGVVAGLVIVAVVAFGAAAAAANNRHAAQELQQAAATPVDAAAAGAPAAVQTALSRKMALKQAYSLFKPMIVLTGDSITEYGQKENGWALSLASTYARRADVVNRGFGGVCPPS